jgi:SAM-dependent methyltransferase
MAKYFVDRDSDTGLEADNEAFWEALLDHIGADVGPRAQLTALDVGCHRGGLLEKIATRWRVDALYGIEPHESAREHAERRLRTQARVVEVVTPERWNDVPTAAVTLVTCHEVLYLIEDVGHVLRQVSRVLAPNGVAYFVHGCHPESPVWPEWRRLLEEHGIAVYGHPPLDIIAAAADAGLSTSARPLRRDGWVRYDPQRATYRYPSMSALLEHHYRHKLMLRMMVAS